MENRVIALVVFSRTSAAVFLIYGRTTEYLLLLEGIGRGPSFLDIAECKTTITSMFAIRSTTVASVLRAHRGGFRLMVSMVIRMQFSDVWIGVHEDGPSSVHVLKRMLVHARLRAMSVHCTFWKRPFRANLEHSEVALLSLHYRKFIFDTFCFLSTFVSRQHKAFETASVWAPREGNFF